MRETKYATNQPVRGNITRGADRILNKPRCKVYLAGALTLAANVVTTVSFDTVEYDTDGMASPVGLFLTCRTAGLYVVQSQFDYRDGYVGPFWTRILRNNNANLPIASDTRVDASFRGTPCGTHVSLWGTSPANAGDTFQLYVNAIASNAAVDVGQYNCFLSACLISTL